MIRLASSGDLDAVAAIYEEILAAEELRRRPAVSISRRKTATDMPASS